MGVHYLPGQPLLLWACRTVLTALPHTWQGLPEAPALHLHPETMDARGPSTVSPPLWDLGQAPTLQPVSSSGKVPGQEVTSGDLPSLTSI